MIVMHNDVSWFRNLTFYLVGFLLSLSTFALVLSKPFKVAYADAVSMCTVDGTTDRDRVTMGYVGITGLVREYADPAKPTIRQGSVTFDFFDRPNMKLGSGEAGGIQSMVISKVTIGGTQYDHCVITSIPFNYVDQYNGKVIVVSRAITEMTSMGASGTAKFKIIAESDGRTLFDFPTETTVTSGYVSITRNEPLIITSPTSGQTLTSNTVNVTYTKRYTGVHAHFTLDGGADMVDTAMTGTYTISGVANGSHILRGYLENASNVKINFSDIYVAFSVNAPPAGTAPSITTQPTGKTVTEGQTASFSIAASGTAPLSYQWKKNGTSIGGATSSSYTTPATTLSDSGSTYTCTVTNSYGSATSNAAILTVNALPPVDQGTPTPSLGTPTPGPGTPTPAAPTPIPENTPAPQVGVIAGSGAAPKTPVSTSVLKPPTNLTAEDFPGDQGENTVLKWTASTTKNISGYMVYRSLIETDGYINIAQTEATVLTYIDTSASVGVNFFYIVRAVKSNNESVNSNTIQFASIDNLAPIVPSSFVITAYSTATISFAWLKNPELDLKSYLLTITNSQGTVAESIILEPTQISYDLNLTEHSSLKLAESYTFTLQALDTHSNISAPSEAVTGTFKDQPSPSPTSGTASASSTVRKFLGMTPLAAASTGGGAAVVVFGPIGYFIWRKIKRLRSKPKLPLDD